MTTIDTLFCIIDVAAGLACLSAAVANALLYKISVRVVGIASVLGVAGIVILAAQARACSPLKRARRRDSPSTARHSIEDAKATSSTAMLRPFAYIAFALIACDLVQVPAPESVLSKWREPGDKALAAWTFVNSISLCVFGLLHRLLSLMRIPDLERDDTHEENVSTENSSAGCKSSEQCAPRVSFSDAKSGSQCSQMSKSKFWQHKNQAKELYNHRYERTSQRSVSGPTSVTKAQYALPHSCASSPPPSSALNCTLSPLPSASMRLAYSNATRHSPSDTAPSRGISGRKISSPRRISLDKYKLQSYSPELVHDVKRPEEAALSMIDAAQVASTTRGNVRQWTDRKVCMPSIGENIEVAMSNDSMSSTTRRETPSPFDDGRQNVKVGSNACTSQPLHLNNQWTEQHVGRCRNDKLYQDANAKASTESTMRLIIPTRSCDDDDVSVYSTPSPCATPQPQSACKLPQPALSARSRTPEHSKSGEFRCARYI